MAEPDFGFPLYLQFASPRPGEVLFFFVELSFLREMEIGQIDVNYVGLFRGIKKFSRRFVVLVFAKAPIVLTYNIRVRRSFYKELASELDSFSNKNTMAMEGVMV